MRQRTPGGRSAAKSYTHSRALVQRPSPREAAASSHDTVSGAGARGSPKWMALALKRALICRTCATSPCGPSAVMVRAWALAAAAPASQTRERRTRRRRRGAETVKGMGDPVGGAVGRQSGWIA